MANPGDYEVILTFWKVVKLIDVIFSTLDDMPVGTCPWSRPWMTMLKS